MGMKAEDAIAVAQAYTDEQIKNIESGGVSDAYIQEQISKNPEVANKITKDEVNELLAENGLNNVSDTVLGGKQFLNLTWELGNLSTSNGGEQTSTTWTRTSGYTTVSVDTTLHIDRLNGHNKANLFLYKYNEDKTFDSRIKVFENYSIQEVDITLEKGKYYRFVDGIYSGYTIDTLWSFYLKTPILDYIETKSKTIERSEAMAIGEYNTILSDRLNDNVLYSVFGKEYSVTHNGKISKNSSDNIAKFVWLSDMHICGNTWNDDHSVLENMVSHINNQNDIDFVVCSGDVIDAGYTYTDTSIATRDSQLEVHDGIFGKLNIPYYPLQGNHDIGCSQFTKNGVIDFGTLKIISIFAQYQSTSDTNNTGLISIETLNWLETVLKKLTGKVIVMCHFTLDTSISWSIADEFTYNSKDFDGHRDDLIALLDKYNVKYYFSGHVHNSNVPKYDITDNLVEVNMGAAKNVYGIVTVDENISIEVYDSNTNSLLNTITL